MLAIIEDLHWADPTTLELLALAVERIEHMRLLLVVTAQPDVQPDWIDHPVVTVQPLGRFDWRQANALIEGVAGESRLSETVRNQIIAHSDGVRLFVEELTKTVLANTATDEASDDVTPGRRAPVVVPSITARVADGAARPAGGRQGSGAEKAASSHSSCSGRCSRLPRSGCMAACKNWWQPT